MCVSLNLTDVPRIQFSSSSKLAMCLFDFLNDKFGAKSPLTLCLIRHIYLIQRCKFKLFLLFYFSAGTVQPLDVRKCHVVPVKQNLYMPITIERDMKGVVGYSPKTDATASHIKKGKAKRRTILPTKHTQPVLSYSLIPIYRHGELS